MPISWTLVWFGVLGAQNKDANLGVEILSLKLIMDRNLLLKNQQSRLDLVRNLNDLYQSPLLWVFECKYNYFHFKFSYV